MSMFSRLCASVALPMLLAMPAAADTTITLTEAFGPAANWALHSDDSWLAKRAGCYEGLTRISNDITVEPALATAWTQTGDLTWDFTIREGVTFQDGTALTAETAANALNKLLAAEVPARAFSPRVVASVEATGPMTVTITTVAPLVTLPGRLASPPAAILSPAAYTEGGINPIGTCTGPFRITAIDPEQSMTLEANPDYWGGAPQIAGATVRFVPDADTRTTMVRSGEAQIVRHVPAYSVAQLKSDANLTVSEVTTPRVIQLLLNNETGIFADERVRRAVRLALDTQAIDDAVFEGLYTPAASPFRPEEPWAPQGLTVPAPDLDAARALLAEAGVAEGTEVSLLIYNTKKELATIGEVVQAMLAEIGIKANIRLAEYAALEPDMLAGNYDMAFMSRGYLTDAPEPGGFLAADYGCEGSFNISQHCSAEFDAKLAAINANADPAARNAGYAELAQYLYDKTVSVFLVNEAAFDVNANTTGGYLPHPLNYVGLSTAIAKQ
ncbi:MAG: ABC transporter substrate-binding protein [Rhodobacteraceae bacterium]|jgi:peptide/nickel transport system substrate-binding protein|nr:ABC transporter substrate-binding protein [Paracoccaceae bacterium]